MDAFAVQPSPADAQNSKPQEADSNDPFGGFAMNDFSLGNSNQPAADSQPANNLGGFDFGDPG